MLNAPGRYSRRAARAVAAIVLLAVLDGVGLPGVASAAPVPRRWVTQYSGGDNATASSVSPDGSTVFVTGGNGGRRTDGGDYATVAYDTATGAQLWVRRFDGLGHRDDYSNAVDVSPDGSTVFVTGMGSEESASYVATIAYDAATGSKLWVAWHDGPDSQGEGRALVVSPDGSEVFVTGHGSTAESDIDWITVGYDAATGAELWMDRYDGPGGWRDSVSSLGISPDGSTLFVTGSSMWLGSYDQAYVTIAYDLE
jgi:WD40 repeat protein